MKKDRKQQILDVAKGIIIKKGFTGLSYNDIAKELGITKATIHHHYPEKKDLGIEYAKYMQKQIRSNYVDIMNMDSTGKEKVDEIVRRYRQMVENEFFCPIGIVQSEIPQLSKDIAYPVQQAADTEVEIVSQIIQQGIDEGDFAETDNLIGITRTFVSAMKGLILNSFNGREQVFDSVVENLYINVLKLQK